MPELIYHRAVELLEAELGDELVALDADAGDCFGFNSVATRVWRELATPRSFDELQALLLEAYEVDAEQCSRELSDLLDDLMEKGLVAKRRPVGGEHNFAS